MSDQGNGNIMANKNIIYKRSADGQHYDGSVSLAGKTPATSSDVPADTVVPAEDVTSSSIDVVYEKFRAKAGTIKSTGKDGTDIPPLVAEVKGKGRFYVADPKDRDAAVKNIDAALASGKAFPSITTVMDSMNKPQMMDWAVGQVTADVDSRLTAIREAAPEDRERLIDELLARDPWTGKTAMATELEAIPAQRKEDSAIRGTAVHALAEAIAHGETPDIPDDIRGYVEAYIAFRAEYTDFKYVYTEATVINREDGTMGTTDAIVKVRGHYYVVDYKTNKNATVYATTGMQLAAAANAESIIYPDGHTEVLPEISGGIGVGLGPDGRYGVFFFETVKNGPNHQGFKAAKNAWNWQRAHHRSAKPITKGQYGSDEA